MSSQQDEPARSDPYAALRFPNYRLFIASSLMAVVSGKIQIVALGYELYRRTGQPSSLGWLALALGLPMLVLGLPAGQISDWFDRKRIVIASQALSMLTSLGLAAVVFTNASVDWMYVCVALRGVVGTFGRPARQALLPQIVPLAVFPNAVTWNSSIFQLAMIGGPALGGLLVALPDWQLAGGVVISSVAVAFLVDALSLSVAALLLVLVERQPVQVSRDPATLKSLIAGARFVWRTPLILGTITLDMLAVLLGGANYLYPVYARDILQVGATGLGWMEAAPAAGAICMAMLLAHLPPMKRAGRTLLWAVVGFGVVTIVFGLSRSFWLSMFMLFLAGAFDNISVVVRHTLVQTLSPDSLRGRISAVNSMFIGASNEMGGVESAFVAQQFGPVASVVSGGIGTIFVVGLVAGVWPGIARIGSLRDVKPAEEPAHPAAPVAEQAIKREVEARPQ